jgi:hypothetical protein
VTTRPDLATLARLRSHVGRINTGSHVAIAALDDPAAPIADVVDAVSALLDEQKACAANTVTVLLFASLDARPAVRAVAAKTMAGHPYGPLTDRLPEMLKDADPGVRAAAETALGDLYDGCPTCMQCGIETRGVEGAISLPQPSNPHAAYVTWPVFCSPACAVTYACDRAQETADDGAFHQCIVTGDWGDYTSDACDRCLEAEDVGRAAPGAQPMVAEPRPPSKKRAPRKKPTAAP